MSHQLSIRNALLTGVLFFLICFGLGYPILNRYDPGKLPGTSDAADYCQMVREPVNIASYRPLVPMLAKPFYWVAIGHFKSWDPALFGMLMATSILSATTAVAIISLGLRCGFSYATALLGAMLFLVNFAVPNWNLAAYIDSGEAFFLTMVAWSLLSSRWYLLPVWAIPGSLCKETFAPFAVLFAVTWWLAERPCRPRRLIWIAVLAALSGATVLLSFSAPGHLFSGALGYARQMGDYQRVGFLHALIRTIFAREFLYTFVWLAPLGLLRLTRMDRRWVWATAATFLLAVCFGAYDDALGNTTRAFFNIAGPLLSLSAASLLTETLPSGRITAEAGAGHGAGSALPGGD